MNTLLHFGNSVSNSTNAFINSALLNSIKQENPDISIVKELLNHPDADPNKSDLDGNHLIHIVSIKKNLDILNLLIEKGADLKVKNGDGFTALHCCCQQNWTEGIQVLLQHGINPLELDKESRIAVQLTNNPDIIQLFM